MRGRLAVVLGGIARFVSVLAARDRLSYLFGPG
jgi:hypothetical protein